MIYDRKYGIDILRIIAMIMVLLLHINGMGGIYSCVDKGTLKYFFSCLVETLCFCAVDCFGLITGYLYINKKFDISNIINLWTKVFFYCFVISMFFYFKDNNIYNLISIFKSFFPVTFCKHWYFKSYFLLYFMIPFINKLLHNLNRNEYNTLLVILLFCCSVMQTIYMNTLFQVSILFIMYLIGAYIRLYEKDISILNKSKGFYIFMYVLSSVVAFLPRLIFIKSTTINGGMLLRYESPFMLIQAVSLFLCFKKINISNTIIKRVIAFISKSTFSIYVVHMEEHIFSLFIENKFIFILDYSMIRFIISILMYPIIFYSIILVIDCIREKIFFKLKIDCLIKKLSNLIYNKNLLKQSKNFIDLKNVK